MDAILNLLTPGQIQFIINTYGSVADWFAQHAGTASIVVDDYML